MPPAGAKPPKGKLAEVRCSESPIRAAQSHVRSTGYCRKERETVLLWETYGDAVSLPIALID